MNDFILSTKSTIDKKVSDLATSLSLKFVDLDDTVNTEEILTGNDSCLVWRFLSMDEEPSDPLYGLMFVVGVKTTGDAANYSLLSIVSKIKDVFQKGSWIDILDYSSLAPPTAVEGSMYITDSGVDQHVMDRKSGSRMLTVEARCIRSV